MAKISLPNSPFEGQRVIDENTVYTYDSVKNRWNVSQLNVLGTLSVENFTLPNAEIETFSTSNNEAYTANTERFAVRTDQTFTFNYKVSRSSKVLGIETNNMGSSNVTHYKANSTIVVSTPTSEEVDGTVSLLVSNGRKTTTKTWQVNSSFIPPTPDQVIHTSSTTWTVPANVRKISAVAIGAGGNGVQTKFGVGAFSYNFQCGGGGGALAYVNELDVTPGEQLTIVCGSGTDSYIERGGTKLLLAKKGRNGDEGGASSTPSYSNEGDPRYYALGGQSTECIGDQAYSGGDGWLDSWNIARTSQWYPAGGGAAAGWEEDGSDAGVLGSGYTPSGGWKSRGSQGGYTRYGGGGQGLYGKNGVTNAGTQFTDSDNGHGAGGGLSSGNMPEGSQRTRPNGGTYGGAGGARSTQNGTGNETPGTGANGAIRIIWGEHSAGVQRAFPETGTADV